MSADVSVAEEDDIALCVLLDWVAAGEAIVITRQGRPIARLVPAQPEFDREKAQRAVENIIRVSRGVTLGGLKVKDLINEGRS
jgi:prevent-host-death family protein